MKCITFFKVLTLAGLIASETMLKAEETSTAPAVTSKTVVVSNSVPAPSSVPPPSGPGVTMQATIEKLHLTSEQKQKVESIFKERREKLNEFRRENGSMATDRVTKLRAITDKMNSQLKEVLNAGQYSRWMESTRVLQPPGTNFPPAVTKPEPVKK